MNRSTLSTVDEAIAAIARGEIVVVADDADRENEGDLIMAASLATAEKLAFIVRHSSGVICVALPGKRLDELNLPLMVATNTELHGTAFTVSVDWKPGTTTGISAADRAATIRALADPRNGGDEFARPGHVFPLRGRDGGVLERRGHTEAAADLARLASLPPAGVLCEIVNDDGTMARGVQLEEFAKRHGLHFITIGDLAAWRRSREPLVQKVATARMPTRHGVFIAHTYRSLLDGAEHVALVKGDIAGAHDVLVRVHSECLTGDILGSMRCDCGPQLELAMRLVESEGRGVIVYLRGHEGRGIGLTHKMRAYALQDDGRDTVEANTDQGLPVDSRNYDTGAQILTDLGLSTIRLMSNNPAKFRGLEAYDLRITGRVPLITEPTLENVTYLRTKQIKLGHLLNFIPRRTEADAVHQA
ncbi:MAG: bifunctional 3,4-dihydroxy-2-butanone-4-phosphate synthase/GTP cyclohydrolase [Akkermansiaceae bacterium]|nr:bifunctional 3,4-dihydroxy-2-butanone-4-phosphate synthase/GTP cyclohydrolase [Akkermansiaceae bacterium]